MITIKLVRELFDYDPETGIITRKVGYGRAIAGQKFITACGISVLGKVIRLL
jgi:hypothetical protein